MDPGSRNLYSGLRKGARFYDIRIPPLQIKIQYYDIRVPALRKRGPASEKSPDADPAPGLPILFFIIILL